MECSLHTRTSFQSLWQSSPSTVEVFWHWPCLALSCQSALSSGLQGLSRLLDSSLHNSNGHCRSSLPLQLSVRMRSHIRLVSLLLYVQLEQTISSSKCRSISWHRQPLSMEGSRRSLWSTHLASRTSHSIQQRMKSSILPCTSALAICLSWLMSVCQKTLLSSHFRLRRMGEVHHRWTSSHALYSCRTRHTCHGSSSTLYYSHHSHQSSRCSLLV